MYHICEHILNTNHSAEGYVYRASHLNELKMCLQRWERVTSNEAFKLLSEDVTLATTKLKEHCNISARHSIMHNFDNVDGKTKLDSSELFSFPSLCYYSFPSFKWVCDCISCVN